MGMLLQNWTKKKMKWEEAWKNITIMLCVVAEHWGAAKHHAGPLSLPFLQKERRRKIARTSSWIELKTRRSPTNYNCGQNRLSIEKISAISCRLVKSKSSDYWKQTKITILFIFSISCPQETLGNRDAVNSQCFITATFHPHSSSAPLWGLSRTFW